MGDTDREVLNSRQCAALLGFTEEHVRRLSRCGVLPAKKVGGAWRYSRRRVMEWLEDGVGARD